MSAPRPALLPLFRSQNQLSLLATLLLNPQRRFSITELAEFTRIPQPSVSREVKKLLETSVLAEDSERGRRVFHANTDSPIFPELASLMLKTLGPVAQLREDLAGLDGIHEAYIYGSWARRYTGAAGSEPHDIDLLVVGHPDVSAVRRRADRASESLGRDVNVTILSPEEWAESDSPFIANLQDSPLVPIDLKPSDQTATSPAAAI